MISSDPLTQYLVEEASLLRYDAQERAADQRRSAMDAASDKAREQLRQMTGRDVA